MSSSQSSTLDTSIASQPAAAHLPSSDTLSGANAPRLRVNALRRLSVLVPLKNARWQIEPLLQAALTAPVALQKEIVVVDYGSTDGSTEAVSRMAEGNPQIRLIDAGASRRAAAMNRALAEMSGDVAVLQDPNRPSDPNEWPHLLHPIMSGQADAVFGSRWLGGPRRIGSYCQALSERTFTFFCNLLNNTSLTDAGLGAVAVRADILRELRLTHERAFEVELLCRLAQWQARIVEVPVSLRSRPYADPAPRSAGQWLSSLVELVRCRWCDPRFTYHTGMQVLRAVDQAQRYNRWLIRQVAPYLGNRLAEAGSGIGNLSQLLLDREHLLLVDHDPMYVAMLEDRFAGRSNVRAAQCDLTAPDFEQAWQADSLDTILCSNVLEHLEPHYEILRSFNRALMPGGHCIIIVPAEPSLYTPLDESLGHYRRYRCQELADLMTAAGFDIVDTRQFCKAGSLAWLVNGRFLRRRSLAPSQMLWFDRLWPVLRQFDAVLPWPGMSLIAVGRKPAP